MTPIFALHSFVGYGWLGQLILRFTRGDDIGQMQVMAGMLEAMLNGEPPLTIETFWRSCRATPDVIP